MPKPKIYPCQYPDCPAHYDERLDQTGTDRIDPLSGWYYMEVDMVGVPVHDHILNIMHSKEVEGNE